MKAKNNKEHLQNPLQARLWARCFIVNLTRNRGSEEPVTMEPVTMKPLRAEGLLCAEHWACGFCPSDQPGSRFYDHPHLAEQPAGCREGKGLGPSHTGR